MEMKKLYSLFFNRSRVRGQGYLIYMTSSLKNKLISLGLVTLIAMLLCIAAVWQIDHRISLARQAKNVYRLNSSLEQILIARFANTSETLAKSDAVMRLLRGELSDADMPVALTLNTTRSITGADFVYLLDRKGVMIAASEHRKKWQTMGKPHDFRPYFQAGMRGQSMLYPAVGAMTKERGAYFSSPVVDPAAGKPIGVAVVKAGLTEVDKLFSAQEETVLLISPDGVIFSTNRPDWMYRTCHQLGKDVLERIFRERQFPEDFELKPLPVDIYANVSHVNIDGTYYDVHKQETVIPNWKLVSLSRHVFPVSGILFSGGMILLLSLVIALYLISLEKKKTLQYSFDKQSLDLSRTRKDLFKSEALLQSVVEDQAELICRFDAERRITFVNGAFCRYFGKTREQLIGELFDPTLAAGDLDAVTQQFCVLTPEKPVGEIEFRILVPEYGLRWQAATIRKVFDEDGNVAEYQIVLRDITARKQNEEALKEANTELSQYAYVISHDLRAPLRAIHNYADFLREDLGETLEGDQKLYLNRLDRAINEAELLIDDVLALSRVSHCNMSPVRTEMGTFLKGLIVSLELHRDVKVVLAEDWPAVEAEPVLLKQIFQNLIVNAAKYNTSSEKLVELGWRDAGDGNYDFFVRDNGIGIDKRYHEQIFRVFERLHTREEYEGTGAGLAIVKKAVSRLHGSVRVESEAGSGSTFYVTLPGKQKEMTA